jgi:hypothetical protein
MTAVFFASQYFQVVLGYSPLGTGLRFLPWTATPLVVAPAAGMLSDRFGPRPVLAAGMFLQAVGLGWFAVAATPSAGYGGLVAPLLVAGIGVSMGLPAAPAAGLGAVAPTDMGKASGVGKRPAALRRGVRHRGGHGRLRRQRAAGHARELHVGLPPGAGPRRRTLTARRGRRSRDPRPPAGAIGRRPSGAGHRAGPPAVERGSWAACCGIRVGAGHR